MNQEHVDETKREAKDAVMSLYRDITYDYSASHIRNSHERAQHAVKRYLRVSLAHRAILNRRAERGLD